MRCPRCGCARLEIVNEDARADMQEKQQIRVDNGTRSTTLPQEKSHVIVV
jgi:hypothetical protein